MARKDLEKAYELINKERLDEALAILRPITLADPDNADAWWLIANAASEPRDARQALVNVLRLNPKYPKARQLLDQLNEQYPPRDDELLMMLDIEDSEPELPSGPLDAVSFDLDDDDDGNIDSLFTVSDDDDDDDFEPVPAKSRDPFAVDEGDFATEDDDPFASLLEEDSPRERTAGGGRRRLVLVAAILLVVCLVGAVLFALLRGGSDDTAESDGDTVEVADPADLISADVSASTNLDDLESVRVAVENDAKASVDPSATALYVQTESGLALVVQVCATPGPTVFNLVRNGFDVVAPRSGIPNLADELTMVGVNVQDCANEDVLYRAMASAADAAAYSNRSTDYATFQQTWQNVES